MPKRRKRNSKVSADAPQGRQSRSFISKSINMIGKDFHDYHVETDDYKNLNFHKAKIAYKGRSMMLNVQKQLESKKFLRVDSTTDGPVLTEKITHELPRP